MAEKYTYADVIIDTNDPRAEIGKEYYSAIMPYDVLDFANHNEELAKLIEVDRSLRYPFHIKSDCCDCWTCLLVRKKEPEKRYVPFDLSKEEDRAILRGAWMKGKVDSDKHQNVCGMCSSFVYLSCQMEGITAKDLLRDFTFLDGTPCGWLVEE